jgi:phosphoglycerate dehydrogenase-like enzyme
MNFSNSHPKTPAPFRVGVTSDFLKPDGTCGFGDIGFDLFEAANISFDYIPATSNGCISIETTETYDALLVLGPRVGPESFSDKSKLRIVARFGVGFDNIDVPACTDSGTILTITPDGVRRPVAVAALTMILALSHKLLIKDQLTREGRWKDKLDYNGQGVTGRTLGIVGFGNIGQELAKIAKPLDMKMIAFDPMFPADRGAEMSVDSVSLDHLLSLSDYVVICCSLNEKTYKLMGPSQFSRMKSNAYFINVARGPIVDQVALTESLRQNRIAGAGLDVFDPEPIDANDPLLGMENVIVSPHAICWTDECFGANGRLAIQSILDVKTQIKPRSIVNEVALSHPRWRDYPLNSK